MKLAPNLPGQFLYLIDGDQRVTLLTSASPTRLTSSAHGEHYTWDGAAGRGHIHRITRLRVSCLELRVAVGWRRIGCMNVQEVEKLLTSKPFEPFGIYMSDGSAYAVTHPDQVILTPRATHVGIGSSRNGRVMREVVICALVHITRLGPVPKTPRKRHK